MGLVIAVVMSTTSGSSMGDLNACRAKIIGFEQRGYYSNPSVFRTAESFCYVK